MLQLNYMDVAKVDQGMLHILQLKLNKVLETEKGCTMHQGVNSNWVLFVWLISHDRKQYSLICCEKDTAEWLTDSTDKFCLVRLADK